MIVSQNIFLFFYTLMVIVLILKAVISIYIANKVIIKKKKIGKLEFDFLLAVLILFICLFFSRLLYFYFDFYLTELDSSLYYLHPNVDYWKMATFLSTFGFVVAIYVVDKDAAKFKFKGIPALILFIISLIKFFYPVNSIEDFNFISSFATIEAPFILIIPIIFTYIGIKGENLRKLSFIIVAAVLIYGGGGLIMGEHIAGPLKETYGEIALVYIYSIFALTKMVGLILLSYAFTKFYVQK